MELFVNMGFVKNPFSKFSAEDERTYLMKIYETPRFYQTLLDELVEGNSRYLLGERGVGKSALMFYLIEDLKSRDVYSVMIDEYDETPIRNNGYELLFLVEKNIITKLGVELLCNKSRIKKLKKDDREKLAFLINVFFKNISKNKMKELYEEISGEKKKNIIKRICNYFLIKPINTILSGASNVAGATVSKALGLPIIDNNVVYLQFISELSENGSAKEYSKMGYKDIKEILRETAVLIEKLGYKKLVIFFDKLDEYTKLKSQIDSIVEFIEPIATDTSLIYSPEFGFEFLLWNKLKEKMKEKQVRFDKARPIDINWSQDELRKILTRRLSFFSEHKVKVEEIFLDSKKLDRVIELANGSPRQLTMLLAKIYEEQSKMDGNVKKFSDEAVKRGMNSFCQNFEYELFYPKMGIKDVVNRILKIGKDEFTISDLASATKKSIPTATNWVRTMKNVGFVEETEGENGGKAKVYKVTDPKIQYMLEHELSYLG
ncbi:MAG: P-loop ATPase, Sll1717 family [Butyrivibrio sp.]